MKPVEKNDREVLDRSLARYSNLSQNEVQAAVGRVWQNLQSGQALEETTPGCRPVRRDSGSWQPAWIAVTVAALVVLSIAVVRNVARNVAGSSSSAGIVETTDSGLSRVSGGKVEMVNAGERLAFGEILRSNSDAGAALVLKDGSRIEMRSKSELTLEAANDGVRILLNDGSVIVTAARQLAGRLYVQTQDVTVSVVGTVFLVNAEEEGSRVAVIQGEVRVQQGPKEKKLLPGEQIATSPLMESPLVSEEISWSRNAGAHLALLQRATALPSQSPVTAPPLPEFAVVSIKTHETQYYNNGEYGFGCRGIDGARGAEFGSFNISIVPQGRCFGDGVTLRTLLPFVYGPSFRLRFGLDVSRLPDEIFQIEGVSENPSAVTVEQLVEMLRTTMVDRFRLTFHREPQDVAGHALVVAGGGQKLQEVSGSEELPRWNGPSAIRGKSSLDKLAQFLTSAINAPVVDKTGLRGIYEYEVRWSPGPGGGLRGAPNPQTPAAGPPAPRSYSEIAAEENARRAAGISDGLGTLGLRLQGEKVSVEVLVIDHVEPPSPN